MRLHHLTVTAFGPFGGSEHVDFDALGAAGLFLFTGPTGAGKTSVLDAICFALYGQVPGARQGARRLRSDHAAEGSAPEVVLEATIRGRRLRISRSPAWERPKRRGDGVTTEQAKVLVQELVRHEWVTRCTRLDDAGLLLGNLLGLSMAQFCQVVLLPQGQFAAFLRADPDQRRALLETLFDTRRFTEVEAWLVARRQEAARALAAADAVVRQQLARVCEAAGCELPDDLGADTLTEAHCAAAGDWLSGLRAAAEAELTAAGAAQERALAGWEQAGRALADAEQLRDRAARRAGLEQRLTQLLAQQEAHEQRVAELQSARRVAPVLPLLDQVARAEQELATLEDTLAARFAMVGLAATGTDAGLATVRRQARDAEHETARLGELVRTEQEAARLEQEADALGQQLVALTTRSEEVDGWLRAADPQRSRLERELADAREAAGEAALLATEHETTQARLRAARQRDQLTAALAEAERAWRQAVDRHQQAREEELAIRETRLAGMAAELAAALLPGEACPVCGSCDHPAKASPAGGAAGREQEQAAADRTALAEAARTAADARRARLREELAEARAQAGGQTPVAELEARLGELATRLADVRARAEQVPGREQALADFDQAHERYRQEQVALAQQLAELRTQQSEHRRRAAELAADAAAARGDHPTVAARLEQVQQRAEQLGALAELLADHHRARAALAEAELTVQAALAEHGLVSADEVRASARDSARMAGLEQAVQDYTAELTAVREQLADPTLAVDPTAVPDLAALQAQAEQADREREEATRRRVRAQSVAQALARLADQVAAAIGARRPLADRHRLVDGLSRLAEGKSGDNRFRMSLSAYVLAARLEAVAAAASNRLQRMSSGRYTLLHSTDAGSARGRGGLSLRVLDAWTGQERDPASLSGGETFSASLALALGLADVVTAEAGGASLETLFVDEGFGTLDDETLDEVMSVLDDLREGGRTVGIVSHVAELRQRIPTQLRIVKGRSGSTIAS